MIIQFSEASILPSFSSNHPRVKSVVWHWIEWILPAKHQRRPLPSRLSVSSIWKFWGCNKYRIYVPDIVSTRHLYSHLSCWHIAKIKLNCGTNFKGTVVWRFIMWDVTLGLISHFYYCSLWQSCSFFLSVLMVMFSVIEWPDVFWCLNGYLIEVMFLHTIYVKIEGHIISWFLLEVISFLNSYWRSYLFLILIGGHILSWFLLEVISFLNSFWRSYHFLILIGGHILS